MNKVPKMGKQQVLKTHNRTVILNAIRQHAAISRADLARQTGLSVGTVTGLTGELIQEGLIFEKHEGDSRGGRPPILLALYPEGAYVVGLKLTEDHITLALTNLDADIVNRETVSSERSDPEHIGQRIAEGIHTLLQRTHVPQKRLMGIGIGMAGIVDAERGICRSSPIWGWKDVPFAEIVERLTGFPVFIDNDVNTLTQVERLYGRGVGVDHFLIVTVGRGVGLGIVTNGQLYRGMGGAGELGHTAAGSSSYVCDCGKQGCLETFVGDPWLIRRAAEQGLAVANAEALAQCAQAGNSSAIAILRQAGEALGKAIATLVNVLHPQLIIISGEGIRYGEFLLQPAREALNASVMPALAEELLIHVEPLGDDAWARGAATLVLNRVFASPLVQEETIG